MKWSSFLEDYSVSEDGQVRNDNTGNFRKPQKRRKNAEYLSVAIKGKNYDVHRLVANAFIPNPEGLPEVRHLDSDPTNNLVSNLAWGTHKENIDDAFKRGSHTSLHNERYKAQQNEVGKPSKVVRKKKYDLPPGIQLRQRKSGPRYLVYLNSETFGAKYLGTYQSLEEAVEVHRTAYFEQYGVYPKEQK